MRYIFRRARLIPRSAPPLSGLLAGNCYAVEETVAPGFRDKARKTLYSALIYTIAGTTDYIVDGTPVRIHPGSLLILASGISFCEKSAEGCHNRYLMLDGPVTADFSSLFRESKRFAYWRRCPQEIASAIADAVALAHTPLDVPPWPLGAALCRLAGLLCEKDPFRLPSNGLEARVAELVHNNLPETWRIATLARHLGMSSSALAHRFHESSEHSPAAFVRKLKCAAAKTLLETGLSVVETSGRCGFRNPYHFSRAFKLEHGSPPSSYIPRRSSPGRSYGQSN